MAVNILFVENENSPESESCKLLCDSRLIKYTTVKDLEAMSQSILDESYTHIVCHLNCDTIEVSILKSLNFNIPVLVVCNSNVESNLTNVHFSVVQEPLTYKMLFDFIAQKSIISDSTLEKYAMGDQDFIDQMKQLIIEEFEENLSKIPSFLIEKNFKAVKSNMHQLIGKFAMLEMEEAHQLSKSIDNNILKDANSEIPHVYHVLFDVEIALSQLKCSA